MQVECKNLEVIAPAQPLENHFKNGVLDEKKSCTISIKELVQFRKKGKTSFFNFLDTCNGTQPTEQLRVQLRVRAGL